jgi:hypothetical protein
MRPSAGDYRLAMRRSPRFVARYTEARKVNRGQLILEALAARVRPRAEAANAARLQLTAATGRPKGCCGSQNVHHGNSQQSPDPLSAPRPGG